MCKVLYCLIRFENSFEFLAFSRNDLEIVAMYCLKINFD